MSAAPFTGPDGRELTVEGTPVLVSRSARRRRTISARREGAAILVLLPAGMSRTDELKWVPQMARRVLGKHARRAPASDGDLLERAERLAAEHLDPAVGRVPRPTSVRWVTNQNHRWGSCSLDSRAIRLSSRLQEMPQWVQDYVLVHELTHLVEAHHTPRFHALVARHPHAERAKGYLEGWSAAQHLPGAQGAGEDWDEADPAGG